jgi:hypothetical protein
LVQYTTSKGLVVTEEVTNAEVAEEAAEVVAKNQKSKKRVKNNFFLNVQNPAFYTI